MHRFFNGVLGVENLVDTLHGCESLGDGIAGLGEFLQGIDDAVENHHIEYERGRVDGRVVRENKRSAEPEHDDDDAGSQELADGMRR